MNKSTSSAGHGPQREAGKEKFWRQMLRDFAASRQSVRAFCSERDLSEPSFYAWRRMLAERDAAGSKARPTAKPAPMFLPIRLAGAAGRMEIVLPGGTRIRLRPPVDRSALIEVVAALRAAAGAEA